MRIWVYSPSTIVREAMSLQIVKLKHKVVRRRAWGVDAAVIDYRGVNPLPKPPPCPTIVLVDNMEEAEAAVARGYAGYLLPEDGSDVLKKALNTVPMGNYGRFSTLLRFLTRMFR